MSRHTAVDLLYKQISNIRRSGDLIRCRSPVIQQWPWEIGVALEHGSMAERMKDGLGSSDPDMFQLMILVSRHNELRVIHHS